MTGRLQRLTDLNREEISFRFDDKVLQGQAGDTVLTAILSHQKYLRSSEFGPEGRAGFCLMGACQDCWVWQADGQRLQACSTPLWAGMHLLSHAPKDWPG